MNVRRILFWIHLCGGSVAGIVILIMCLTGIALVFERQINSFADRLSRASVTTGAVRLPLDRIMATAPGGSQPLSAITIYSKADEPVALAYGRERTVFIDPYSGKLLGEGSKTSRAFFAAMERWHRALGSELRGHGPGRVIADAANFVFLGLVLSGFVLWLPRNWTAQRVRAGAFLRRNLKGKAAFWNIHNVVGIWCAVPLFFIVLTGVIMSYTWANNLLYRLSGSEPPPANVSRLEAHEVPHRRVAAASNAAIQVLFDRAQSQTTDWRSISLRFPVERTAVLTIDAGNGGQPNKRAQLTLDARAAEMRRWEPFRSYSAGRQMRSWARFLHTGEAVGIPGQIIAAIAALGGAVLVCTGITLALIRLRSALSSRSRVEVTASRER